MQAVTPTSAILCNDLFRIKSGEILTSCGSFQGSTYRGRLAFYPKAGTGRQIEGVEYQKATYETGCRISGCQKVLDLPGEQHFLVNALEVERVFPSRGAFNGVPELYLEECQAFIQKMRLECGIPDDCHGLTGSGALHEILPASDFDWVLYLRNHKPLRKFVTDHPDEFIPEFTFSIAHVLRKYGMFEGLTLPHLQKLFGERWKYFRYGSLRVSVSFVDEGHTADHLLESSVLHHRTTFTGVVAEGTSSYHMPYVIPIVSTEGITHQVLTWQFLYNGAFETGDKVEVSGVTCTIGGDAYILVGNMADYIRKPI